MNRTDTVLAISSWWAESDGEPMTRSIRDHIQKIRAAKRDLNTFRVWFLVALAVAILALGRRAPAEDVTVRGADGEAWTISINPKPFTTPVRSSSVDVPPAPVATEEIAQAPVELAQAERPVPPPDDPGIEIIPARTQHGNQPRA